MNDYQKAYNVLANSENVFGAELYDQQALTSGLQFSFYPTTPATAGAATNYRKMPFPYKNVLVGKIRFITDLSLITDAIKLVLMNANVIISKNDTEMGRYSLISLMGLVLSNTVLDTTLKPYYYSDPKNVPYLIKPIALAVEDRLSVVVNFTATTGLTSNVLSCYANVLASNGVLSNTRV